MLVWSAFLEGGGLEINKFGSQGEGGDQRYLTFRAPHLFMVPYWQTLNPTGDIFLVWRGLVVWQLSDQWDIVLLIKCNKDVSDILLQTILADS